MKISRKIAASIGTAVLCVTGVALAAPAQAATGITVNSVSVEGGDSLNATVHLTYACDANSGVSHMDALLAAVGGDGFGTTWYSALTCDGANHNHDLPISSVTQNYFSGQSAHAVVALVDANGNTVGGAVANWDGFLS